MSRDRYDDHGHVQQERERVIKDPNDLTQLICPRHPGGALTRVGSLWKCTRGHKLAHLADAE